MSKWICLFVLVGLLAAGPGPAQARGAAGTQASRLAPAATITALDSEGQNVCALVNGSLLCWGHNDFDLTSPPAEYRMPDLLTGFSGPVSQFALGDQHRCVVVDGGAWCWGFNVYGQLGDGTTGDSTSPRRVVGLDSGVKELALGMYHTCALKLDGTVYCWGFNRAGQLGDGTMDPPNGPPDWKIYTHPNPVQVINLGGPASRIFAGGQFSCALVGGALKCWGANEAGQLGDNSVTNRAVPGPVQGLSAGISDVAMGYFHACAVQNGALKCWGNSGGVVGDGTLEQRLTPVSIAGFETGVSEIDSFTTHTCAVRGAVFCWGDNAYGQLGDGTFENRSAPVQVLDLPGATLLALGMFHTCALGVDQVYCWGSNLNNQLGDGTLFIQKTPARIDLPAPVSSVSGDMQSGCAAANGAMYCWGNSRPPAVVAGFESGVTQVSSNPVCALQNGAVVCADGHFTVGGLEANVTALSAGGWGHACAVVAGAARCFGVNMMGQLGNGSTTSDFFNSVQVTGLTSGVTHIATAGFESCAVKNNQVYCWGSISAAPLAIPGASGAIGALSTRCAAIGGALKCWSYGGSSPPYTPNSAVTVAGLESGVTAVAQSEASCAVQNGAAKCWGANRLAQLGDGSLTDRAAPTQVLGLSSGVTGLGMGWHHSCAIQNGQLYCWGYNRFAQVGDNNPTVRSRPVRVIGLNQVPEIVINYIDGQPKSIFNILGSRFPAGVRVRLLVNGVSVGEITTDTEGVFIIRVNTGSAAAGFYFITAQVLVGGDAGFKASAPAGVTSQAVLLKLDPAAPLRLREGSAQNLDLSGVQAVILDKSFFIPITRR